MERNAIRILEQEFNKPHDITENLSFVENEKPTEQKMISHRSLQELIKEENDLKTQWDNLKKKNFCLQATINAWQSTLEKKLDEFKEAQSKLDETYSEVWSEREKFCSSVDKFNSDYGILSNWWHEQMNFVSEMENLERKRSEDQECRKEIEKLEREIDEVKKEMKNLEKEKEIAEVEVHSTPKGEPAFVRCEHPKVLGKKQKNISQAEDEIQGELFSLVNVEKVRVASRKNNRHKVFFGKFKQFLSK